ncbi:MAG: hypothetical protein HW383_307 [Candidatus Magasanikbacteria bacterium]|nr:hypothetical protein [Candidatus Magasanikbacteria bacterium]
MPKLNDLPEKKGKIINVDGQTIAVYRDGEKVKAFSTVCPHRGCDIDWNDTDGTWDCPCHGSRFEADGALKHGPAKRGLEKIDVVVDDGEIKVK